MYVTPLCLPCLDPATHQRDTALVSCSDLSSWTNAELLECLYNLGDRVISKDTRDAFKKSRFTGEDLSNFFKEAWGSRNGQQVFSDSLDSQLGNLRIKPEQLDRMWQWLNEILIAAADSENTDEAAASEQLELSIKVLRWMYVKNERGASKYVAYELQVMAPFVSEAGAPREMETRTYLQRWSEMNRFNERFKTWAQGTAKIAGTSHMFEQQISSKWFRNLGDPKTLETRKMELNDHLSKLAHWANDAADKRLINLPTLIDEVVEPCFGADPGGRSPMGKRTSENVQETDQVYSGWLNYVSGKKSEPFHAVLVRAGVDVKELHSVGCNKGTFGLYHGPKEREAEFAVPLPGAFVTGCEEVGADPGDKSPKEMHGLHQFALQWHEVGSDRHGSVFALQKHVFNAADEEVVEEWVRRCRRQQRENFREWSDAELGKWLQATSAFGEERPLIDCGIDALGVEELVNTGESRKLKKALRGLQRDKFSDLWTKLRELLVDDLGAGLADPSQGSPDGTTHDENFYLHVQLDTSWTKKDVAGFVIVDDFVVEKIKKKTAARDIEGACEGMQLTRIKGSGLDQQIRLHSLSYANGMAQLTKAFSGLDDHSWLTLVFKLPWRKLEADNGDTYFWNEYTDVTTWDAPEEVVAAEEAAETRRAERDMRKNAKFNPNSPWVGYISEDTGEPYYVRDETEESVWDEPRIGISRWGDASHPSGDVDEATEDGDAQGELLPSESGELTVKLVHCRDLIAGDPAALGGLSDPMVKMTLGGKHHHTTDCQRNTVDPDFNIDAFFPISADDSRDALKLAIEVWDWNKSRPDELLGVVELSLPCEFAGGWTNNTKLATGKLFQLKDPDSRVDSKMVERKRQLIANRSSADRQKIKALLKGLDRNAPSFDKDNLYGSIWLELRFEPGQGKTRRPASAGRLQIMDISCKHILPTSSTDMSSTYCEFWLANNPKNKHKTGVDKNTLDPRWFEDARKPWEFMVTENADEDLTLHAQIRSKSSGSLLGQCKIDLTREFADGWTPTAKPTAKSLLSDPHAEVRKKDIDRVRKPQFKGKDCAEVDYYGTIKITMIFRQDEVSRNSLAQASASSTSASQAETRAIGSLSMKILGAKGGFLTDERTNRSEERNVYFEATALKDGVDVLPVPKRSQTLSMGSNLELVIKDRHLSRTTFELESPKGRPDVVTVRCLQESEGHEVPKCLGVCVIDIRHKTPEAWIAPLDRHDVDYRSTIQGASRVFDGAEYTGGQDDIFDRYRIVEELCTVLREDMHPHEDDCNRISYGKRRQQEEKQRLRRGSGRTRRGSGASLATGEPLNWLKVSMSWTPPDTLTVVERVSDITGVWRATMKMMPTGEDSDYDVEINPDSPWVGIWQDGKPFFYNETTKRNLPVDEEEPDEGIREWKMRPGTMTRPDKEKGRKGKNKTGRRRKTSPLQEEQFLFLYQETQPDGSISIGGHEAGAQMATNEDAGIEWHGAEYQHTFTIQNARLVDSQLIFEMVRVPEEGLLASEPPEVTRWEATLNFASRRIYNGKISGARCGTFEATRPPTHICERTHTMPLLKLCPELLAQCSSVTSTTKYSSDTSTAKFSGDTSTVKYSSGTSTGCARTISLRRTTSDAEMTHMQLEPVGMEPLSSKVLDNSVKTLARPDDDLKKFEIKSARKHLKQEPETQRLQIDNDITLLEASSDNMVNAVEISKQAHKRGWVGSLHVVSEQAIDWKFTLRIPEFASLEVIVDTLELDESSVDDLDLHKVWCAVVGRSTHKADAETKKLKVDERGFITWHDPNDGLLEFHHPEDASYCFVDICGATRSRASSQTLGRVRVPIPRFQNGNQGEEIEEEFENPIESDDIRVQGTLSGFVRCTYEAVQCTESLDLSLWFCQSGQLLAREVVPRHRCIERSGTFKSHAAGQLLYLIEDELWNPVRVAGAHSAPPCKGTFSASVLRARNLTAADETGQSDPYVKLRLLNTSSNNEQEQKTRVVKRQLSPTFNEQFNFDVDTDGSLELHVEVWDQDVIDQDDFLGEVKIPLADVMNAGANSANGMAWLLRPPAPLFYQLEDPQDRVKEDQAKHSTRRRGEPLGAVQLSFAFFLSQADRQPPPAEQGTLHITLDQCLDLLPAKMDPPSSQPFVRFKCGKEQIDSKVCKEASLSPDWHGTDDFQLNIGQDMVSQQDLDVEVWDNERPRKLLGCCTINLPALFYHGWEEPDPPMLIHQLDPTTKDGEQEVDYGYLLSKRKIMKNPDRVVTNVDNPENECGAIRMRVAYVRTQRRHSPRRNRWTSPRKAEEEEAAAPTAGTLRVVAACAQLEQRARDRYLSLRIAVDEYKTTQRATEVAMTQTEGRSKKVHWQQPMDFNVPQGEQRVYVEIFECSDASGRKPKLLDSGDLEFSMISGQNYDLVNLESGDLVLTMKIHYMPTGLTGLWKANCEDEDDGETSKVMLLKEAKDGRIKGSCVWDEIDGDYDSFDIVSGEKDPDTNEVRFEQQYSDDSVVDWKATLRDSELRKGAYGSEGDFYGKFRAKQLPNANSKKFWLELTAKMNGEDRGQPSKELIHKAHITGVTRRLHRHCEQKGARKPSQMRHGMLTLRNLPPTPSALDRAYAMYGLALEENAEESPQNLDPDKLGFWQSNSEGDDETFHMPFYDLNQEFHALLRAERSNVEAPQHQKYCNADHGLSKNLPPPPWLLDSAERAAMSEMNHSHEHVASRRIKDTLHAGVQIAFKLFDAGVSQVTSTIHGDSDDAEDSDSDADDPEPEPERSSSSSGNDGRHNKSGAPPPSPKGRSRSLSTDRANVRDDADEAEPLYNEGDFVEVFSNGAQDWLEAEVLSVSHDRVTVQYSKGGKVSKKALALSSEDVRQPARRATSRSPASPSRLTLSPAKDFSKMRDVTIENHSTETLELHFDDGNQTKKVRKGKSVSVQMRKGDDIWATASGETVWGPERLGKDKAFTIEETDLMAWIGSAGGTEDTGERSRTKRASGKKKKKKRDTKKRKQ